MKNKSLNFIVTNEVYPFDVMFSFGETDKQLKKKLSKFDVKIGNLFQHELRLGLTSQFKDNGQVLVRLRHYPKTPKHFGTLGHEISHATNYVMSYIGNKLSEDSEESYAYFTGFLTQKVFEKLIKK